MSRPTEDPGVGGVGGRDEGRPADVPSGGEPGAREVRLPMTSGRDAGGRDDDSGGGDVAGSGGGPPGVPAGGDSGGPSPVAPGRVDVSAFRLVSTLTLAGAVAGLVIVLVHQWSRPRIEAHQARVLREAIYEVLGGPERYETAFLVDGSFTVAPPPAADTAALERIYVGYDGGGQPMGVAVAGGEPGFQDVIRLLFGYDPGSGEVVGMKVLESKETPGLGDKIEKDSVFVAEFAGVETPLEGVKSGRASGADNEVDMITGATISSRTVIDIINHRLEGLQGPIASFWARGAVAGADGEPSPDRPESTGRVGVEAGNGPRSTGRETPGAAPGARGVGGVAGHGVASSGAGDRGTAGGGR